MKDRVSGIYKITNTINNKCYIGQSVDIYNRWQSYKSFYKDTTKTEPILLAIREIGIDNFSFDIVCECEENELNEKEQYYIKEYNSCLLFENSNGYNISVGNNGKKSGRKARKVICIDTNEVFDSAIEASIKYGIDDTNIRRCCSGTLKQAKGMKWEYYEEDSKETLLLNKLEKYKNEVPSDLYEELIEYIESNNKTRFPSTKNAIKVICNENGKIYDSMEKCCLDYGVCSSAISDNVYRVSKRVKSKIDGNYYTFDKIN